MLPFYEKTDKNFRLCHCVETQYPPHLHSALELVYQESGTLVATVDGQSFTVPPKGLALVFPYLIHSYSPPVDPACRSLFLIVETNLLPAVQSVFWKSKPKVPVLTEERIPEDVLYALRGLNAEFHGEKDPIVTGAFLQLLLGRLLPQLCLDPVSEDPNSSMIYRLIRYISMHFLSRSPWICLKKSWESASITFPVFSPKNWGRTSGSI